MKPNVSNYLSKYLSKWLSKSMGPRPLWEAVRRSTTKQIPITLWIPIVHSRVWDRCFSSLWGVRSYEMWEWSNGRMLGSRANQLILKKKLFQCHLIYCKFHTQRGLNLRKSYQYSYHLLVTVKYQ
jgi:hypothetical protein